MTSTPQSIEERLQDLHDRLALTNERNYVQRQKLLLAIHQLKLKKS